MRQFRKFFREQSTKALLFAEIKNNTSRANQDASVCPSVPEAQVRIEEALAQKATPLNKFEDINEVLDRALLHYDLQNMPIDMRTERNTLALLLLVESQ